MSLALVRRAAEDAAEARVVLEVAIRNAAKEHSLRAVAEAAGLSHEQVRRIAKT